MAKSEYYTILTKIGIAKFIAARASGNGVNLKSFKLSSKVILPSEEMDNLEEIVYEANISSKSVDEKNPNYVNLMCHVPSNVGGFEVNAIGIYDEVGDLLAVGNTPRTYKPLLEQGSAKELMLKIVMELSNADEVILKLDPSVIMASRDYVDAIKLELEFKIDALKDELITLINKKENAGVAKNLVDALRKEISSLTSGLGIGQQYVNCKSTRKPNVKYTNTTKKPIMVIADSANPDGKVGFYVDDKRLVDSEYCQEVTFIVPPNSVYWFNGPCFSFYELR